MARIPFQNELTENLRSQRLPSITNTATVENLAAEENQLAKIAGIGADVMQKFAIKKQNEEDVKDTQYAFAAWKEHEFKYESNMLRGTGEMAQGSATRTKNWWQTKGETFGAPAETRSQPIFDEVGNDTGEDRLTHYEAEKPIQTAEYLKFKQRYDALPQRLKNALDLLIEKRRPDMLRKAMAHESSERIKSVTRATNRAIKAAKIQAIHNFDNTKRLNEELNDMDLAIKTLAKIEGWGDKETRDVILGHVSEVHQTVISQYLAQNTDQGLIDAENYRTNHPGEFTVTANKAMITAIRNKEIDIKSDTLSESILAGDKDWLTELSKIEDREVKKATRTKLYTEQRLLTHGRAERVRQQENAMYEMVVQAGKDPSGATATGIPSKDTWQVTPIDFKKLGPDLQPIWDALPYKTKEILKKIHFEQRVGAKPINELVHLATYGRVAAQRWLDPNAFKITNFALKYYGMLKPSAIVVFENTKAGMLKDEQDGKGQKDYMTRWFMRAGWVGDDYAPRIGQAYIDLQSEINEFEANNDGRRPDDLKLQAMIQEKMGDYDYVKALEKEFPIAPDAPAKPAAGEALGVRAARALNIAGYFKGPRNFAGKKNSEENRTIFRKAAQRIDLDVEIYKAAHGGQISDRRELAIINRIANDLVYVDGSMS